MKTVYYFTDGALDQVAPDTAAHLIARGEARLATHGDERSYLRQIAEDDAQAKSVADRIDGYDRDDLGASQDY